MMECLQNRRVEQSDRVFEKSEGRAGPSGPHKPPETSRAYTTTVFSLYIYILHICIYLIGIIADIYIYICIICLFLHGSYNRGHVEQQDGQGTGVLRTRYASRPRKLMLHVAS